MSEITTFRFEDLAIWQRAADIAVSLDEIASKLDERRKYRFAEQLRAAALSISNNIAEGSGSNSDKDFVKFLYIARKSTFECASMLLVFSRQAHITRSVALSLVRELAEQSRMIVAFANSIQRKSKPNLNA